jgi:AraC family transcriptional regulator
MHVAIEIQPEKRVAAISHRGPYSAIWQAFDRLGKIAGRARLFETPVAALVGIYYDDPRTTPAAELRSAAGIVVSETAALPEGLSEARIPAGRYAKTTYVGPYQKLGGVWARFIDEWLPWSGHRLASTATYERYLNTPMEVKPEELRTELYMPLVEER